MQSKKFVKPLVLNALMVAVSVAAGQAMAQEFNSNQSQGRGVVFQQQPTAEQQPTAATPSGRSQTWPKGWDGRSQNWPGRSQHWNDGRGVRGSDFNRGQQYADAVAGARDANRFVQDRLTSRFIGLDPNYQGAWFEILGDHGDHDDDGAIDGYQFSYNGVQAGGMFGVGDGWRVGGAFTYLDGRTKNGFDGHTDSNNYYFSLFADKTWGQFGLLGTVTYGFSDFDKTHREDSPSGRRQEADYDGDVWTAGLEGRYDFLLDNGGKITPYAGINYSHYKVDSFHEDGGEGAMQAGSETYKDIWSNVGARYTSKAYDIAPNLTAKYYADLGWTHEFNSSDDNELNLRMSRTGQVYKAESAELFGDAAVVKLGAEFAHLDKVSFGLNYTGMFADETDEHAFNATVNVPF